jgi:PhzF family phenazine biosynthesis protein
MPLDAFPPDATMQAIAAENNVAETAFIVRDGADDDGDYRLRWFTPTVEVPLCGHATLARAAVVMQRLEPQRDSVTFRSASGPLTTRRRGDRYVLDFPARTFDAIDAPPTMVAALGATPLAVHANALDFVAVLADAATVRDLTPDFRAIAALGRMGVIVTAAGDDQRDDDGHRYDFVSRYFAPAVGIDEDPVTGAAHCTLAPYWAARTGRDSFRAYQASKRGGEIACRVVGDRVTLEGGCVFYLEGFAEF